MPPSYSINWDSLLTTTLNNTSDDIYDNVFGSNPIWAIMHANDRKAIEMGGAKIQRSVEYAQNGTVQPVNGYDPTDLTPQEEFTALVEEWREYTGSVVISKREELLNRSEAQLTNLLQGKINNLAKSYGEVLSGHLLAPTQYGASAITSPGVGSSGALGIIPLAAIVNPVADTTLHGIDASSYDWWEIEDVGSNNLRSASYTTGPITYAKFRSELRNRYNTSGRHNEGFSDLVVTSQTGHETYVEGLDANVRYTQVERGDQGFRSVQLEGTQLVWDRRCPRYDIGTGVVDYADTNGDGEIFYFLNTKYLQLCVQSGADMVNLPFQPSYNQTARRAIVYFMGQLICTNRRTQTMLHSVNPANISG